jgi:hypothetical protein
MKYISNGMAVKASTEDILYVPVAASISVTGLRRICG